MVTDAEANAGSRVGSVPEDRRGKDSVPDVGPKVETCDTDDISPDMPAKQCTVTDVLSEIGSALADGSDALSAVGPRVEDGEIDSLLRADSTMKLIHL